MTRPHLWILRACLTLCGLLVCSCIDIHEELWIHKDGSAKAEVTCDLPRAATLAAGGDRGIRALVDKLLAEDPNIDRYETQITQQGDRTSVCVRVEVDQLLRLDKLQRTIQHNQELPKAVRLMVGSMDVGLEGLTAVKVMRSVSPGEAAPALKWLPAAQLKDRGITSIIHFPYPVRSSNAHHVEDGGRTIRWETSLATAITGPVVYEFIVPLPIPWLWIGTGGAALAALVVVAVRLRKRPRDGEAG